jgi:hypothetical protein
MVNTRKPREERQQLQGLDTLVARERDDNTKFRTRTRRILEFMNGNLTPCTVGDLVDLLALSSGWPASFSRQNLDFALDYCFHRWCLFLHLREIWLCLAVFVVAGICFYFCTFGLGHQILYSHIVDFYQHLRTTISRILAILESSLFNTLVDFKGTSMFSASHFWSMLIIVIPSPRTRLSCSRSQRIPSDLGHRGTLPPSGDQDLPQETQAGTYMTIIYLQLAVIQGSTNGSIHGK